MNTLLFNILLLVGCLHAEPCDVQSQKNLMDSGNESLHIGIITVEINEDI